MTIVHDILKQMPGRGQPQRTFLAPLFVTILGLRGRVTCRTLRRSCDYAARTLARQFRQPFDWPACHQRVLPPQEWQADLWSRALLQRLCQSCRTRAGDVHTRRGRCDPPVRFDAGQRADAPRTGPPRRPSGKQPGATSTRSNCARIAIACRRAFALMAWTATRRRRHLVMPSSAWLSTGLPPKRRGARRQYDGKVTCQTLSRFEALGTREEAPHLHL
jgi:hypothetical protein